MKNVSLESLTPHTHLIFDDFSCFWPILGKNTQEIGFPQQNSPILDFREIQKLINVKTISHFRTDGVIFRGS